MATTVRVLNLLDNNNNIPITATSSASPQKVNFSAIKDIDGNAFPSSFTLPPSIYKMGQKYDRSLVINSVDTTGFYCYMQAGGGAGITNNYYYFNIVGD